MKPLWTRTRIRKNAHTRLCVQAQTSEKKCTVCASHMCSINRIAHHPPRHLARCPMRRPKPLKPHVLVNFARNMSNSVYWHGPHHAAHSGSTRTVRTASRFEFAFLASKRRTSTTIALSCVRLFSPSFAACLMELSVIAWFYLDCFLASHHVLL